MLNENKLCTVSVTVNVSPGCTAAGDTVASTSTGSAEAGVVVTVRNAAASAATTARGLILIDPFPSVGPLTGHDGTYRLPQDRRVEGERPVLDVAQVQPDRFLPRQVAASADLPQPGHPR